MLRRTFRRTCLLLHLLPGLLAAQQPAVVSGRVIRLSHGDTIAEAGARVVLHRIARAVQGPFDSTLTGARGEFGFRWRADTASVYLLSSSHDGIEYFSTPVHLNAALPDTGVLLVVSDTSSTAPVTTISRHIVISKPATDGTRSTLEIVMLANLGSATRVAGDTTDPVWAARLPTGAIGFQPGNGDVAAEAMASRNDSVMLFAPVAPGDKQLIFTYSLPPSPGTVRFPVVDSIGIVNLLLEEFAVPVRGGALVRGDSQAIEGRSFRQWTGAVPAGGAIDVDFPGGPNRAVLPALVGGVALLLGLVLVRALRRAPVAQPNAPGSHSALDSIAALDARYAGKESEVPATEWVTYLAERERLKAILSKELARQKHLS
ncbi:MAG: hypothetical protein ABI587_07995 [Gemmatimonadales bacterium]